MTHEATIIIRPCHNDDLQEPRLSQIVTLINEVYAVAEVGMWAPHFKRVQKDEVITFIRETKLIFALKDDRIVGSIFVTKLNASLGEFGMLVCDPSERHQGIGRRLIAAAEEHCRNLGCSTMQLELLYPRDWPQKTKEILKEWYPKLGYQKGQEEDFNKYYPQLKPVLATECVFAIYKKSLPH